MLQNGNNSLPERCGESLKDQVGIALADSSPGAVRDIVPQYNVVERKHRRWSVGEMRYRYRCRGSTVLVQENKVGGRGRVT